MKDVTLAGKRYLDTSSIRLAGKRLLSLINPKECSTSAFTLIELLNGVRRNDEDYAKRGGCIKHLANTGILIDWTLPDERMATAFDTLDYEEERVDSLKCIYFCLVNSVSRVDFVACERSLNLPFPIEFWEDYDTYNGRKYIEVTANGNRKVRDAFERERERNISLLPASVRQGTLREICRYFTNELSPFNLATTEWAIAARMASQIFEQPTDEQIEQIANSYNGRININVRAFSYASMIDQAEMRTPGRNDPLDLAHFLYLREDTILVCEDIRMKGIAKAIGVQTASIVDLLNI